MKTKILRLSLLLIVTLISSCSNDDDQIIGSGNIISEERTIGSFDKVVNPSSINISVVYGDTQAITVSADDNIIDRIKTTLINETLTIDLIQGNYNDIMASVTVTIPLVSEVENSGSGNISFSNFDDLSSIVFNNSGSGSIEVAGSTIDMIINNSGSGSFNGFDFTTENATVNNSGSGSSEVYCNNNLSGSLSGSGSIFYKGASNVTITDTGSGSVVNSN